MPGSPYNSSKDSDIVEPPALAFPTVWVLCVLFAGSSLILIITPYLAVYQPLSNETTHFDWRSGGILDFSDVPSKVTLENIDVVRNSDVSAIIIGPIQMLPSHLYNLDDDDSITNPTEDIYLEGIKEFETIIIKAKEKGFMVLINLNVVFTSVDHPWFIQSQSNASYYNNYYAWHEGLLENDRIFPPNNWVNEYSQSAWSWNEYRNKFYYHSHDSDYPNLNHRAEDVEKEMMKSFDFWIKSGADGFFIKHADNLFTSTCLLESQSSDVIYEQSDNYINKINEVNGVISRIKSHFDQLYKKKIHLFLETSIEEHNIKKWVQFYDSGADMVSNFIIRKCSFHFCGGECLKDLLAPYIKTIPDDKFHSWMVISPSQGDDQLTKRAEALNLLSSMMPGAVVFNMNYLKLNAETILYLKKEPAFKWGKLEFLVINSNVVSFIRMAKGWSYSKYIVSVNIGKEKSIDDYTKYLKQMKIHKTEGKVTWSNFDKYEAQNSIPLNHIELEPSQFIIMSL